MPFPEKEVTTGYYAKSKISGLLFLFDANHQRRDVFSSLIIINGC